MFLFIYYNKYCLLILDFIDTENTTFQKTKLSFYFSQETEDVLPVRVSGRLPVTIFL